MLVNPVLVRKLSQLLNSLNNRCI